MCIQKNPICSTDTAQQSKKVSEVGTLRYCVCLLRWRCDHGSNGVLLNTHIRYFWVTWIFKLPALCQSLLPVKMCWLRTLLNLDIDRETNNHSVLYCGEFWFSIDLRIECIMRIRVSQISTLKAKWVIMENVEIKKKIKFLFFFLKFGRLAQLFINTREDFTR